MREALWPRFRRTSRHETVVRSQGEHVQLATRHQVDVVYRCRAKRRGCKTGRVADNTTGYDHIARYRMGRRAPGKNKASLEVSVQRDQVVADSRPQASDSGAPDAICQGAGRRDNILELIQGNLDDFLECFYLLFHGPAEARVHETDGVAYVDRHLGLLGQKLCQTSCKL